ncbi:MAG TPA: TIGR04282 family arsenosugar biosynthesis glycosyltransferase [Chthoniobacterales bacterium]|nr:TIGR04282 family arsenosugar biosynthesis glycosyltransferase [Chthoniobacterales bacterium]
MTATHHVLDPAAGQTVGPGLVALGVMTKAPQAGRVKTRLTPPLTAEEAAALNTCFLRDTAVAIAQVAATGRAKGIGVYTPIGAEAAYQGILPEEFDLLPQRGDGFDERLLCATEDLLSLGFESVCLIDSDSPTVPPRAYAEAVAILAREGDRIVLGPSDDGGYYLIGLKKVNAAIFTGIDWSTERVLEQTLSRAREGRLEVHLLPAWYDVDDRATLRRLCDELFGQNGDRPAGHDASHTREYLQRLIEREGRDRIWPARNASQTDDGAA